MLTFETVKLRPLLTLEVSADFEPFSAKADLNFNSSVLFFALRNEFDLFFACRFGFGTELVLAWVRETAESGVLRTRAGVDSVLV